MLSAPFRWFRRNLHADSVFVNTDASGDGFGGWSGEDWFAGEWPGAWRLERTEGSSTTFIELSAVLIAARLWAPKWRGLVVQVNCDNAGCVFVWDKKSSPSERVMGTLRSLVEVCEANGVDVLRFVLCVARYKGKFYC
jgi:hypothetical protein